MNNESIFKLDMNEEQAGILMRGIVYSMRPSGFQMGRFHFDKAVSDEHYLNDLIDALKPLNLNEDVIRKIAFEVLDKVEDLPESVKEQEGSFIQQRVKAAIGE